VGLESPVEYNFHLSHLLHNYIQHVILPEGEEYGILMILKNGNIMYFTNFSYIKYVLWIEEKVEVSGGMRMHLFLDRGICRNAHKPLSTKLSPNAQNIINIKVGRNNKLHP